MTLTIPITGTFDIAVARNKMRKVAEQNNWPPNFRARASAALTVLAEMAIFAQYSQSNSLLLQVNMLMRGGQVGVEFDCNSNISGSGLCDEYSNPARMQLQRASDELEINERNGMEHIVVRLWAK